MAAKKFRSIVIDSVNALQNDVYMRESKKPNFDEWMDMAKELYNTLNFCKTLDPSDIYPILILGKEGSGKTIGVSYLNPEETYYVNTDKKPLTFPGWKRNYKKGKISEGGNYNDGIEDYSQLRDLIEVVYNNRIGEPFFVFFIGHIEEYKSVNGVVAQRLKSLGKKATQMNIEGGVTHTYYSDIDTNKALNDLLRFRFRTTTNGYDSCRSPMNYWPDNYIPNNLQMVIDRVIEMEY